MAKLIIYFSLSNNTKKAAQKIQELTGSDIVRLEPETKYPENYSDYAAVAQKEFDEQLHPQTKTEIKDFDKYETIYLGYPTWNGLIPMIFSTLADKYDFANKTIIPFTTSGSSSVEVSMPSVKKLFAKSTVTDGFRYDNNDKQLKEFIEKFN